MDIDKSLALIKQLTCPKSYSTLLFLLRLVYSLPQLTNKYVNIHTFVQQYIQTHTRTHARPQAHTQKQARVQGWVSRS